jgi:hypothetical protein
VGNVVDGDGWEHGGDGGAEKGCGSIGGGGDPAEFLGEAVARELRESSVKVVARSIWSIGGQGWDFHKERDSVAFTVVARVFRSSGELGSEMFRSGSSMGLGGVVLQGWFG